MNIRQEARLTMFRTTEQILDDNASIVAAVPALVSLIIVFKSVIASILNTTQLADVNLTGIAADKASAKNSLALTASDFADIIGSFASATKNATLKAEVKYSLSKLSKMRDEALAPVCRIIHDRAAENIDALRDYGITPQKLALFDTAIGEYASKTPNTRTAIVSRRTQNANLVQLFRQGNDLLKNQMDGLVKNFRTTHPDFYNAYLAAREITDSHTTVTQLKGSVIDAADEKPIKGAVITIVELGKSTKTNTKGEYLFKPVEYGKFTLKIEKEGYAPYQKEELDIKTGHIIHWHASLVEN
ncbi:MAG: carboxypeptidase-like regulatory domain-containing protein [Pyrinomonadaceae bacterium]|nr:carboxypeptidase-like regulatory domain-containing protein [Pyrinomonadaceae bacterium]